jgi:hypothetical protein
MQFYYKLSLSIFFSISSFLTFAQTDIDNEAFKSTFVKTKDGGKVIFNGKSHAFSIDIPGKVVTEEKVRNATGNQNFIHSDGVIIQTSWIPLPQPIPENMQLSNLSIGEQKQTLDGYVNYEFDYFENDLKTKPLNITKEWVTVGSRLFLVWSFNFKLEKPNPDVEKQSVKQIYFSTVCFNQVLDLNMPVFEMNKFSDYKEILKKISGTLKTYDKHLPLK